MAKLYVAYGSNLNREQMRYRCPTAKFVGTGIIEGYELQFKGALHGACATIARAFMHHSGACQGSAASPRDAAQWAIRSADWAAKERMQHVDSYPSGR